MRFQNAHFLFAPLGVFPICPQHSQLLYCITLCKYQCNAYVAVMSLLITNSFSKYDTCRNMGVCIGQLCSCCTCSWSTFFSPLGCCCIQCSRAYLQLIRGNGYAQKIAWGNLEDVESGISASPAEISSYINPEIQVGH